MSEDAWTWELAAKAWRDLDTLSSDEQDRILDKLDEIVESPWRDPPDYGEPLRNSPYRKVRIGEFRLSVAFRRDERRLIVARIKRRGGAYTAGRLTISLPVRLSAANDARSLFSTVAERYRFEKSNGTAFGDHGRTRAYAARPLP